MPIREISRLFAVWLGAPILAAVFTRVALEVAT